MQIAVIGAGIVGVTTAFELARDGHQVTVFERRASVAEETSFANAGVVAPGYITPWAAPGMPAKVLRHLLSRQAPLRLALPMAPGQLGWMWRWWRACQAPVFAANRAHLYRLAHYSQQRLRGLTQDLQLTHESSAGYLVLLRSARELAQARASLKLLAELGVDFHLVSGARARDIERGLNPAMPLHAALHLPQDEVGNCRQFALMLKDIARSQGVDFQFNTTVASIDVAQKATLFVADTHSRTTPTPVSCDAIVVCAGAASTQLCKPLGKKLPIASIYGYSVSAHIREPLDAPRAALMDEHYKVAISRLGNRVRVAGSAEIGGRHDTKRLSAMRTLYKVLQDWFPGAALMSHGVQEWKGARPMLANRPPIIGASGLPGLWFNTGHGSSGWALGCGSARLLADAVAGRSAGIDTVPYQY